MFRRRYDVAQGLEEMAVRLHEEIMDLGRDGRLSPDAAWVADQALRRIVEDFMVYATVGRDRKKLGREWVESAEGLARAALSRASVVL